MVGYCIGVYTLYLCFAAVEESQSKLEGLEQVTAEYQRAQEEAAEQARKAAELEAKLQETEHMREADVQRLVGSIGQDIVAHLS